MNKHSWTIAFYAMVKCIRSYGITDRMEMVTLLFLNHFVKFMMKCFEQICIRIKISCCHDFCHFLTSDGIVVLKRRYALVWRFKIFQAHLNRLINYTELDAYHILWPLDLDDDVEIVTKCDSELCFAYEY